jgi:hypothetical protein
MELLPPAAPARTAICLQKELIARPVYMNALHGRHLLLVPPFYSIIVRFGFIGLMDVLLCI